MTVGGSDARWATSDLINERLDFKFLRDPDDLVSDCDHSRKSCSYETKPAATSERICDSVACAASRKRVVHAGC